MFKDIHQAKYDLIDKGLPSDLVIDFGSTFRPRYIEYASKNGAKNVLRNLLSTVDHVCLGNPVLKEGGDPCVFLPSVPEDEQGELFPVSWLDTELETQDAHRFVPEDRYTTANWLWGLNAKLLKTWVRRQNFDIIEEITVDRPHAWSWWGCYAVKKPTK